MANGHGQRKSRKTRKMAGPTEFKAGQRVRIGKHITTLQKRLDEQKGLMVRRSDLEGGWAVDPPVDGCPYWHEGMMECLEE